MKIYFSVIIFFINSLGGLVCAQQLADSYISRSGKEFNVLPDYVLKGDINKLTPELIKDRIKPIELVNNKFPKLYLGASPYLALLDIRNGLVTPERGKDSYETFEEYQKIISPVKFNLQYFDFKNDYAFVFDLLKPFNFGYIAYNSESELLNISLNGFCSNSRDRLVISCPPFLIEKNNKIFKKFIKHEDSVSLKYSDSIKIKREEAKLKIPQSSGGLVVHLAFVGKIHPEMKNPIVKSFGSTAYSEVLRGPSKLTGIPFILNRIILFNPYTGDVLSIRE